MLVNTEILIFYCEKWKQCFIQQWNEGRKFLTALSMETLFNCSKRAIKNSNWWYEIECNSKLFSFQGIKASNFTFHATKEEKTKAVSSLCSFFKKKIVVFKYRKRQKGIQEK